MIALMGKGARHLRRAHGMTCAISTMLVDVAAPSSVGARLTGTQTATMYLFAHKARELAGPHNSCASY